MDSILVSIIMPVYQVSEYVERCVRSVIGQTYQHIECIIVDDATKDDSAVKCERMMAEYSGPVRFRMVRHDRNKGLSAARNTGIREATGDYLYFLDSDDELTPDCIAVLVAMACETPDAEMTMANYQCVPRNENNTMLLDLRLPSVLTSNEQIAAAFHSHRIPMNAWNKLLKRSFVLEHRLFFKEGVVYEDVHWSFFVAKHLNCMCISKEVAYLYYMRPGSIVKDTALAIVGESFQAIYDDILTHLTQGNEASELNCYAEGFCNRYLIHRATNRGYRDLYQEYCRKAKEFGCRTTLLKLRLAWLMEKMPFGLKILEMMKKLKTSISRLSSIQKK